MQRGALQIFQPRTRIHPNDRLPVSGAQRPTATRRARCRSVTSVREVKTDLSSGLALMVPSPHVDLTDPGFSKNGT